jgi:hypothetical protein
MLEEGKRFISRMLKMRAKTNYNVSNGKIATPTSDAAATACAIS